MLNLGFLLMWLFQALMSIIYNSGVSVFQLVS